MAAAYLLAPDLHVYQQCRKVPFASRREAMKRVGGDGSSFRNRGGLTHVGAGQESFYRCDICGAWHFGHR